MRCCSSAERRVPIGLASLIFASVPLWLVVLRSTHRRPAAARLARRNGRSGSSALPSSCGPAATPPSRACCSSSPRRSRGRSGRSSPRGCRCRATRSRRRASRASPAGCCCSRSGRALSDGESHNPADWSTRSLLGLLYLIVFGSIFGYTAYVWLVAQRAARHRRHLRVREPARRDHARRPLPRRGGDVADRGRCGGDPDLGCRRDPQRGAAAAGRERFRAARRDAHPRV